MKEVTLYALYELVSFHEFCIIIRKWLSLLGVSGMCQSIVKFKQVSPFCFHLSHVHAKLISPIQRLYLSGPILPFYHSSE